MPLERHEIVVHGKSVEFILKQSSECKRDHAQFMEARNRLFGELVGDDAFLASLTESQRSLRLFSTGSWEVLGEPGPLGWKWHAGTFSNARFRVSSFLVDIDNNDDDDDDASARAHRHGGEKGRRDEAVDLLQDRQPHASADKADNATMESCAYNILVTKNIAQGHSR